MKKRLIELDSLRGIAAISVLVFHYAGLAGFSSLLFKVGVTGVDLFFMISGFVILMSLENTSTVREFIISRLSRLYPSYIVIMGLTIGVIYLFGQQTMPSAKTVLANLTMMQPLFGAGYIDDSYWTLTVEMQFYFLMLLLFITGGLYRVEVIGSIILMGFVIYYLVAFSYFYDGKIYIIPRSLFPIISHFQLFFTGIVFYKMRTVGVKWYRHLIIAACFLINLFLFNKAGKSHFFIGIGTYLWITGLYLSLFYLFTYDRLKFLRIRILTYLGSISYGLYLFHQEIGKVLFAYLNRASKADPIYIVISLFFLSLFIASIVTYKIERPIISSIRNSVRQRLAFNA
ncbi:MAG TPA: acyltransferase [Puia sp.]|jgi:peptidoglycan/LPS O-acetylase OafA/YrhL